MKMIWLKIEGSLRQTLKNLTTQLTPFTNSEKNSEFFLNLCLKIKLLSAATLFALALTLFAPVGLGTGPISLHKKSIPAITYKNISPPYKDYEYFQNREIVPFEYRASSFSLVNAWWLAEASTLVYADETYVRPRFREAGLNRVVFFNRSGTQCFIASNSRFAIVAFRGSEIWNKDEGFGLSQMIADFMTDIDIRLSDWIRGGKVHSGFKTALDSVWDDMLPEIKRLRDRGVLIWVTGHSLGAALATLAADRLPNVQGLYTFGSPRVGDEEFQKRFEPIAFRVINGKDIVGDVPPKGPYRHVGEHIFIDQKGVFTLSTALQKKSTMPPAIRTRMLPEMSGKSENPTQLCISRIRSETTSPCFIPSIFGTGWWSA